ncbi:hypothetical protein C7S13_4720 [Burkholderia cepacia]|nr:hypothetical protein [Burkholderia cepacia]
MDYGNRRCSTLRRHDIEERFPGLLSILVKELERETERAAV